MRKWFKQIAPDRERLLANRWMRPLADRLAQPAIWHFNRRNVARGVALGLFAGFILPIGQVFLAALLAASVRGNLLVAAAATLVTNPITFPPIYYAAFRVGSFLLDSGHAMPRSAAAAHSDGSFLAVLSGASLPTAVGLVLFALTSAILGFLAVHLAWRLSLLRQRRRRVRP